MRSPLMATSPTLARLAGAVVERGALEDDVGFDGGVIDGGGGERQESQR